MESVTRCTMHIGSTLTEAPLYRGTATNGRRSCTPVSSLSGVSPLHNKAWASPFCHWKLKPHYDCCEIEDFVDNLRCKLCVILRLRVLRGVYVFKKGNTGRRLPLVLASTRVNKAIQGRPVFCKSAYRNHTTRHEGDKI